MDQFYDDELHKTPTPDEELRIARARLIMAQAWTQMIGKGHQALVSYGINYMVLPEYLDRTLLDEAAALPLLRGQERYLEYIRRIEHAIDAAIRRRGLKTLQPETAGLPDRIAKAAEALLAAERPEAIPAEPDPPTDPEAAARAAEASERRKRFKLV